MSISSPESKLCAEEPLLQFDDAAFLVANKRREKGRVLMNRCVGSTLLLKGLESEALTVKFVSDKVRTLYAFLRSRVRRMVGRFARQSMIDRDYRRKGRSGFPAVR